MRGCQKRETICKHDLVTLGIIRIGRLVSEAVKNEAEQALSISNKEDHLAGQTYSQGNVKVGTFFEAHQSTWLLKVSGEPLSRFGSSIVRKARPLHTETSSIVVCSTARGIFNGSISAIFNDLCQLMKILDLLSCSNLKTFHHKYSSLFTTNLI
jgi:hypothetical protein